MRVAIIGSRGLRVSDLSPYLPANTTQIISGGARGIDACAKAYALACGISYLELLPDYPHYGKAAPLRRNEQIVAQAELVIAFWDGTSPGTKHTINLCMQRNVPVQLHLFTR